MCNSSPKIIIIVFFFSCAHLDIASVCVRFNPRLTRFKETVFSRIFFCVVVLKIFNNRIIKYKIII